MAGQVLVFRGASESNGDRSSTQKRIRRKLRREEKRRRWRAFVSVSAVSNGHEKMATLHLLAPCTSLSTCRWNTIPGMARLESTPEPRILHTRMLSTLNEYAVSFPFRQRTAAEAHKHSTDNQCLCLVDMMLTIHYTLLTFSNALGFLLRYYIVKCAYSRHQ